MLQKYKTKREEGFTIIEVLIVLAIAGLIILIVFLAVPALQRNSRNSQRANDASLVLAAVSDCLNARNGLITSCNTQSLLEQNGGLDTSKLRQITTITIATENVAGGNFNTLNFNFGAKCSNDGATMQAVANNTRAYAVSYNNETSSANGISRCVQS